jgi:hypothetical protein
VIGDDDDSHRRRNLDSQPTTFVIMWMLCALLIKEYLATPPLMTALIALVAATVWVFVL